MNALPPSPMEDKKQQTESNRAAVVAVMAIVLVVVTVIVIQMIQQAPMAGPGRPGGPGAPPQMPPAAVIVAPIQAENTPCWLDLNPGCIQWQERNTGTK